YSDVGTSPRIGAGNSDSISLRECILLSNKNLTYKIIKGIMNPKIRAPSKIIDFLGATGIDEPYASSIIFKLAGVAAALISVSSLFCNKNKYKASKICCCLEISL